MLAGGDSDEISPVSDVALIVLAAGAGTRMKSALPKPLHPVAGLPMVLHVLRAGAAVSPASTTLVVSPEVTAIADRLDLPRGIQIVVQHPPLGTGDAVRAALPFAHAARWLVVLYGDHPLLTGQMVRDLVAGARQSKALVTLLTCELDDAAAYGRIERDRYGRPVRVVERSDDDPSRRRGRVEINSGMMAIDAEWARSAIPKLSPSPSKGEYYLTDLVELAVLERATAKGPWPVATVTAPPEVVLGVNDRVELARADSIIRERVRRHHMLNGVTIIAPETVLIDVGVEIGMDTTILPFTMIEGQSVVGSGCVIGPSASLKNAHIGNNVQVRASTIVDSAVGDHSDVGPYAHLRGGTVVADHVHIGNYAELKNATVESSVKIGHVSYLGDVRIGEATNIGAGTITCNFDGQAKHRTVIGPHAFIGSDSMLVAPVIIGAGARTGAGSVVTRDVPPGVTVVGVPARELRARVEPGGDHGEQDASPQPRDNE
ncbi:MAG: UDP-N-acetylglucosamine diphosphorylase/glucosamine-1-phosphate N-acetyltransferase [Chloroflexota bacterium]